MTVIALSMDLTLFLLLFIKTWFPSDEPTGKYNLAVSIIVGMYLVINAVALYLEVWRK